MSSLEHARVDPKKYIDDIGNTCSYDAEILAELRRKVIRPSAKGRIFSIRGPLEEHQLRDGGANHARGQVSLIPKLQGGVEAQNADGETGYHRHFSTLRHLQFPDCVDWQCHQKKFGKYTDNAIRSPERILMTNQQVL